MRIDNETLAREMAKYDAFPQELKNLKRWCCWRLTDKGGGKKTKIPINAMSGSFASSKDPTTWSSFKTAVRGSLLYGANGIGFFLGDGIIGVDLDNHPDENGKYPMTSGEFKSFASGFLKSLNTYAEYSPSGKGVHIYLKGKLPGEQKGGKTDSVEIYAYRRFFTVTGSKIGDFSLEERSAEIAPFWEKYIEGPRREAKAAAEEARQGSIGPNYGTATLQDNELIEKASSAKNGEYFRRLYAGDLNYFAAVTTGKDTSHSAADAAFCSLLAFWTNGDADQMDRIFRSSGLMRPKWDAPNGVSTYGKLTIDFALAHSTGGYDPAPKSGAGKISVPISREADPAHADDPDAYMNVGKDGEPIFRIKKIVREYPLTDTGNAMRFYDYFGDCFRYNVNSKQFMFWTGKTWISDAKSIIRKYANKLIEVMKQDLKRIKDEASDAYASDDKEKGKTLDGVAAAMEKNIYRVSNKAGKDAMLYELQSLYDMPVKSDEFNQDPYLLNTESGIVNLKTGEIGPFDKSKMLSKNTGVAVSFEEPKTWERFLLGVFYRGDSETQKRETREIVDFIQQCLGYTLTGSTREQVLFLMYGSGSNGKSTFTTEIAHIFGDYYKTIDSNMLMAQAAQNTSVQFSLATLVGCRFLAARETAYGAKLDEANIKSLTGSTDISAQEKYGTPFSFTPSFKLWIETNNLPIIQGADYGIWRRIILIPFLHRFTDVEKDLDMSEKLLAESPKILGWCIKGYRKYVEAGMRLVPPDCLKKAMSSYQDDMDVVAKFLARCCRRSDTGSEACSDIYNAFKSWGSDNKEFVLRESRFADSMEKKGFKIIKSQSGEQRYDKIYLLPRYKQPSGYSPYHVKIEGDD